MNLVLVGLNHKTAPVEVRECLAPEQDQVPEMLRQGLGLPGVREMLMLSTCNRVEVLAAARDGQEAGLALCDWLTRGRQADPKLVKNSLYLHLDEQAVRHLFRVAASLDSLVLGEPQILGQIKEAYRLASQLGTTSAVLNRLLHKTFQVAKRVRSETNIGGSAVSISYAAVELAKKIFDDLHGLQALLVGAGEMAELAAEHLVAAGVAGLSVANRTLERAVELNRRLGRGSGAAYSLEELPRALSSVDIVITSTGSPQPVVSSELARAALRKRRGRPIFFIDIAVPRDVEPAVAQVDGCFVYDIDDLTQVVEANRAQRQEEAQEAERIVSQEVLKFSQWLRSLEVTPTIAALTGKAERLRAAEVERTLKDLGGLTPEQAQALDRLTKALVKKMLHDPIMFLKSDAHSKSEESRREHLALLRRAFRLEEENSESVD